MKKSFQALLLAGGLAMSLPLFAADDIEKQCQKWAAEDEISPQDMPSYMAECIEEQKSQAASGATD